MSLSIVLARHDAEKLKFLSFSASLKTRMAGDVGKNAGHIWFAATGRQEKRDKCESTFRQITMPFTSHHWGVCSVSNSYYQIGLKFQASL